MLIELQVICEAFMQPDVMLFLGGLTIAAAFNKYSLDKTLARLTLSWAGKNPKTILFAVMFLGMFLSAWVC